MELHDLVESDVLPEMAYTQKKAERVLTALEKPINDSLLKLWTMPHSADREVWIDDLVNWIDEIAEIVRAGVLAVSHGQTEAASALGLSRGQLMKLVVVPQALRLVIPPLTSQYLNIVKNSSLAVFVGYPDLVLIFAGTVLNQTHAAVQVMAITMAVYLAISLVIALALNVFNARYALKER